MDGLCASRSWDDLVELADRCEEALERGKQLWPIAAHIDYRLALEAPGDYAASVLHPEGGRFALAPLTEVAAFAHGFSELADHVDLPQTAAYLAQERILRGEDLVGDARAALDVLELPGAILPWEPTYALATFWPDRVEVAEPWAARPLRPASPEAAEELADPDLEEVLLDLVTPWTSESNGAARVAVVEGDAVAAASALTFGDHLRTGELSAAEFMQLIAWAAASGGAHGRRRGAAFGRFMAWYASAALCDLAWPADPGALAAGLDRLRFSRWDEGEPEKGWVLRVAIASPDGWAAALAATDLLDEGDDEG